MQCNKLDIKFNTDVLLDDLADYIKILKDISSKWPNEIVRVMCNYPAGTEHYTSNKRSDEVWDIIETDEYKLYTRLTKFGTRMVSAYLKQEKPWSSEVLDISKKINKKGNLQVALVLAGPKFRLEKHIDTKQLTRFHIPIVTNEKSYFEIFEPHTKFYPKVGEVWSLDTSKEHAANNDSETHSRIHMIMDFLDG